MLCRRYTRCKFNFTAQWFTTYQWALLVGAGQILVAIQGHHQNCHLVKCLFGSDHQWHRHRQQQSRRRDHRALMRVLCVPARWVPSCRDDPMYGFRNSLSKKSTWPPALTKCRINLSCHFECGFRSFMLFQNLHHSQPPCDSVKKGVEGLIGPDVISNYTLLVYVLRR